MTLRQWGRSGSAGRRATDHAHANIARPSAERPIGVLVVDDDPGVCLTQALYLRALGCKVFTAHDGYAALEQANALSPDVIVMDLEIPRLDPYDAIRLFNESSSTRKIPVITIATNPNSRSKALRRAARRTRQNRARPDRLGANLRPAQVSRKQSDLPCTGLTRL